MPVSFGRVKLRESKRRCRRLILQGTVLTWSALESLARDLFEMVINSDPRRALTIMQEPNAKQRFQIRFTLEDLAEFGFEPSSSLGSALSLQQDFSDIRTMKVALIPALRFDSAVAAALADRHLRLLAQQRHLVRVAHQHSRHHGDRVANGNWTRPGVWA